MSDTPDTSATVESALDLDSQVPLLTFEYYAKHLVTGAPTSWKVIFAGPAHPKTVASSKAARLEDLDKARKIEAARVNQKKYKPEEVSPEESDRKFISAIVSRIVGWSSGPEAGPKFKGKTWAFNEREAVELLMHPEMQGFVVQFTDALLEDRNFMPGSASSS